MSATPFLEFEVFQKPVFSGVFLPRDVNLMHFSPGGWWISDSVKEGILKLKCLVTSLITI